MKKIFSVIIRSVILVVIILAGLFYFVNYQTEGETAYITQSCMVYNSSELNNPIDTLPIGNSVELLVYHGDTYKIRYTDDDGNTVVGFVSDHVLDKYTFPEDINHSVIITVSSKTEFKDFISILVTFAEEDYSVIGVYLDFLSLNYNNSRGDLYEIQDFCEEQHIPWGEISDLNQNSYDNYVSDKVDSEFEHPSYEFKILPYTFRVNNEVYINSSYELDNCVIYTSSNKGRFGFKSWITDLFSTASQTRNSETFNEESIYAYTFYEEYDIECSFISDEWFYDIENAYEQKIEDATRD